VAGEQDASGRATFYLRANAVPKALREDAAPKLPHPLDLAAGETHG
jgi:hypothetical protein